MPKVISTDRDRDQRPESGPTFIRWDEGARLWVGFVGRFQRFRATVDGGTCVMRDLKRPGKVAGPVGDCVFWAWSRLVAEADGSGEEPKRRKKRVG
jgi:hypothetical protein